MERNANAIRNMITTARKKGVSQIVAVGTMALRTAKNSKDFINFVKTTSNIDIEVLPGEEEARLSYLAVKSGIGMAKGRMIIFDTGGGSTEFIFGNHDSIEKKISLNVGAVRFTEQILKSDPITDEEYKSAESEIETALNELQVDKPVETLVGIGGTMNNLGAIKHNLTVYDSKIIQGSKLELADVEKMIVLFKSKTIAERKKIIGLQPKRADVILAGAIIVIAIMKKINMDFVIISDRGLRHGLLVDRFG